MMKKKIIGYALSGHDNLMHVLQSQKNLIRCSECGELLSREVDLAGLKIKKKLDISYSYDGFMFASIKFKEYCTNKRFKGIDFKELPDDNDYYLVTSTLRIGFDSKRRKTRFEDFRVCCNRYKNVAGSTPAMLKNNFELEENTFFWTDVEFGGNDEKHPLLLVGQETGKLLQKEKFTGFDTGEIWE